MSDDIDRLLADLDSEDEGTEDEEVSQNRPKNSGVKQLRDAFETQKKEFRRQTKELEELRSFRSEVEQERLIATATGAGLSDKQATAFVRLYGKDGVTPENIAAFKADVLGVISDEESSAPKTQFSPGATGYTEPTSKRYSKSEFEAIMRSNAVEGWRILNSGLVDFGFENSG